MYSLRRRLLWTTAVLLSALLALGAVWLSRRLARDALVEFDGGLQATAEALRALTEQEDGSIEFDYEPKYMPSFERPDAPDLFEFWLDDGSVLLRSRRLRGDLPRRAGAPVDDCALEAWRGRVLTIAFVPKRGSDGAVSGSDDDRASGSAPGVVLSVGRDRGQLDARLAALRGVVYGAAVATLVLALLVLAAVSRWGMGKVDAIARRVGGLDPGDRAADLRVDDVPRELRPFVDQVQALLRRVRLAMERERRFTGHVAHELRTPIAELRSLATMAVRWPEDRAAVVRYFEDVDQVAAGMERTIEDLMLLARCGAGVEAVRPEVVELRAAVEAAWTALAARARARGLALNLCVAPGLTVVCDAGKLAIVLANLLGNAVAHAASGTGVHCEAIAEGRQVRLVLRNQTENPLPADVTARLTEPFVVGTVTPGHAGLGLPLVVAIADLLRLRVQVSTSPDLGFGIELAGFVLASAPGASAGTPASTPPAARREGA